MPDDILRLEVSAEDADQRLDLFLGRAMEDHTRNAIQKLIEKGLATVNQKTAKQNYRVKAGDAVEVCLPPPENLQILPEKIPLEILYEDKDLIVLNKPQGMVVHPAVGHYSGTVVNALLAHCGEELSGINGVLRPGIVHRIDKDTSGVIVIAKTNSAHLGLSEQLASHTMTRRYQAIVWHNLKEGFYTINKPIGRHPVDRKKMAVVEKHGKEAVTYIKVLERLGKFTWVEARLETGRTHQIRVHLASLGHPILGDVVYGPVKQPFSLGGQTLHAKVLGFCHPSTGEYMAFESPLPDYFQELLDKLRRG